MTTQTEDSAPQNGSTEVAIKRFPSLDQVPATVASLIRRIASSATQDDGGITAQIEIMNLIQSASTLEDIFAAANAGTLSGQDYTNRPFLLHSDNYEWKRSASGFISEGGFPYYALMRVRDLTDQAERVISCGGYGFVATLDALSTKGPKDDNRSFLQLYDEQGGMPLVLRGKQTASGFTVLLLEPAPVVNTVR